MGKFSRGYKVVTEKLELAAAQMRAKYAKRRKHGSITRYVNYGCRCAACTGMNTRASARTRQLKRYLVATRAASPLRKAA